MPVESTHPQYDAASGSWRRMRDVVAGQDAVHAARTDYLPRLRDQSDQDYDAYRLRATWFGATSRTIDALHGLMLRKPAMIDAPAAMDAMFEDVTLTGRTAQGFISDVSRETLEVGRVGVLVDFPRVQGAALTVGAAQAMGARPFVTLYRAESMLNWRSERINNRMTLVLVTLAETYLAEDDGYAATYKDQLRVLRLIDGRYVQEIWRRIGVGGSWGLVESVVPQIAGRPMAFIPMVIVGADAVGADVQPPPMLDMADLNLSHYRSTADLEHGAHYTGLPMLYVFGVHLDEGQKLYLGSQAALTSPDPAAKAGFVEFSGQGLGALESLIQRKEAQMAALGASMLTPQRRAVEAAETHEMRTSHETSMLADIAATVSQAMTTALEWLRDWAGISGDVLVRLNTDFVVTRMSAQELTALLSMWQSGGISRATLYHNLTSGELTRPGVTVEDEVAEIASEGPSPGAMTDDDADGQ